MYRFEIEIQPCRIFQRQDQVEDRSPEALFALVINEGKPGWQAIVTAIPDGHRKKAAINVFRDLDKAALKEKVATYCSTMREFASQVERYEL